MADSSEYWKTTFTVEILSDRRVESFDISEIIEAMNHGDCSGIVRVDPPMKLGPFEMYHALEMQGSDPEFFLSAEDCAMIEQYPATKREIEKAKKGLVEVERDLRAKP